MGRMVLTSVGTSLVDNYERRNILLKGNRFPEFVGKFGFNRKMGRLIKELKIASAVEDFEDFAGLSGRAAECAKGLVEGMRALWESKHPIKFKRDMSSAELASLGLIKPPLGNEDEVIFLYSDTPKGAFCATCLEKMFEGEMPGLTQGKLQAVGKKRIDHLNPERKDDFEKKAVGNLAEAIARYYYFQAYPQGKELILNVTGGFKAAVPIITIIASFLKARLICLYEEATELLWQPLIPLAIPNRKGIAHRLLWAGSGRKEDILDKYESGEKLRNALDQQEWPYYTETGPAELSSLGRAVQKVLEYKDRSEKRRAP